MAQGQYLTFGEQLYLVPKNMPVLKGLKVLRPGLHLGTLKKNRFEPSHAWAHALNKEDVRRVTDLSAKTIRSMLICGRDICGNRRARLAFDHGGWLCAWLGQTDRSDHEESLSERASHYISEMKIKKYKKVLDEIPW